MEEHNIKYQHCHWHGWVKREQFCHLYFGNKIASQLFWFGERFGSIKLV